MSQEIEFGVVLALMNTEIFKIAATNRMTRAERTLIILWLGGSRLGL